jgi:DNA-binding response OmpR family regulator
VVPQYKAIPKTHLFIKRCRRTKVIVDNSLTLGGGKVANILIVDDQAWVSDLCRESLSDCGHHVSATDDITQVRKKVLSFRPDIVLLNQYLKRGVLVWDVLEDIKTQAPDLPVLIVTQYDTHLFCSRLSLADGYLIKTGQACVDFRHKISALLQENLSNEQHIGQIDNMV